MTDALFPEPDVPGQQLQVCDTCGALEVATSDGLRVRGWYAWDGKSVTGKDLNPRVCPACREKRNWT